MTAYRIKKEFSEKPLLLTTINGQRVNLGTVGDHKYKVQPSKKHPEGYEITHRKATQADLKAYLDRGGHRLVEAYEVKEPVAKPKRSKKKAADTEQKDENSQ